MKNFYAILLIPILFLACTPNKANTTQEAEEIDEIENVEASKTMSSSELKKYFEHKKGSGFELVQSKGIKVGDDGTYCFFYIKNGKALGLRLRIQYFEYNADVYELHGGDEIEIYQANKSESTSEGARVVSSNNFKWYEKSVNLHDEELLRNIAQTGNATLILKTEGGAQVATISLTKQNLGNIVRTIDYYKSLNGAKIPKKGMVNIRG